MKRKLNKEAIESLRREYSAGDYLEDRDYIIYYMSKTR